MERHRLHRLGGGGARVGGQGTQPGPHLAGCALGERHRQHLAGRDVSGGHQMSDAAGDGSGLARAGAGEHAHRTARGEHGFALLLVQVAEQQITRGCRGHGDHHVSDPRHMRAHHGMDRVSATLKGL